MVPGWMAAKLLSAVCVLKWVDRVAQAVEYVGTPCYVSAFAPVERALDRLDVLRAPVPVRSWLSYKTHPLPSLAREWIACGRGVEVVSATELDVLLRMGCPIDRLLINGVAKHTWLGSYAIDRLRVHFDSLHEVDALLPIACAHHWRVGVRVHAPDERDARAGRFGGQFGLARTEAVAALRHLSAAGADVQSVHFHLGQGRRDPLAAARGVALLADVCDEAGVEPIYVDCGGGLPSDDNPELEPALAGLEAAFHVVATRFRNVREIWLENGRYVSGSSTALVVRVLDIKDRDECRYVICDGGRTNQALAADRHQNPITILPARGGPERLTTVCGPTCMTDDRLGRWMLPESLTVGDLIVWLNAGAYHLPWETRFSQGLCAIAWFDAAERISIARPQQRAQREVPA